MTAASSSPENSAISSSVASTADIASSVAKKAVKNAAVLPIGLFPTAPPPFSSPETHRITPEGFPFSMDEKSSSKTSENAVFR